MNYLQRKKLAFMSIVNKVKGFIRSISGVPPLALEDCVDEDSLIDYKIYGNSVQNGMPTPEVPIEVQSVGEKTVNLLPYPYYHSSYTINGITFTVNSDGTIIMDGTGVFDTARINDFILLSKSDISEGTYYLSGCPEGGGTYSYRLFVTVHNYYSDGKSRYYNDIGSGTSIDVKENCTITVTIRFGDEIGTVNNLVFKPQLQLGSSATAYEPYNKYKIPVTARGENSSVTTNLYLDEPLRKVGDYADYVDFGKGEVVRNIISGVLNGSEAWLSAGTRYYTSNPDLKTKSLGISTAGIISNALPSVAWNMIRNSGTGIATYSDNRIDIRADGIWETVDEAKEYMTNNPIHYIAPRLEPLEENISLPKLLTIKGTTIYEIGTSLNASGMEATYYSTSKGG